MSAGDTNILSCSFCRWHQTNVELFQTAPVGVPPILYFHVQCKQCGKQSEIFTTREGAINNWNERNLDVIPKKSEESTVQQQERVIDRALANFVIDMRTKLGKNHHKGLWWGLDLNVVYDRLIGEVIELEQELCNVESIDHHALMLECADIANYCMIMHDIVRSKYEHKNTSTSESRNLRTGIKEIAERRKTDIR